MKRFQKIVYTYFKKYGRMFPWRETRDPYCILVSEIMLQQTQAHRVIEKHNEFIRVFPDFTTLAHAKFRDVFKLWQGLGYNRRALALHNLAKIVIRDFGGQLPQDAGILKTLPGIGSYTANAILAFAYDKPQVFIETNIRTVFIHHFFPKKKDVADHEIIPLVSKTLDQKNPREWYYALMDYGAHLKKIHKNPARRSAHHVKQTAFHNSDREIRGMILKSLLAAPIQNTKFARANDISKERVKRIFSGLHHDGLIRKQGQDFILA